ncbi:hypothetical protein [Sorangium sp. So ce887]|uniref:hypothetical protein n=1 Tax=Sorangium sp. So ce887 TaxID=3133324 RepID=UPI003F5EF036
MGHGLRTKARALVLCGCACALVMVPASAKAFEVSGGVSVGGIQIGTVPRLAVSPLVGLLWRHERELLLEVHNMFSVVPGARVGACERTADWVYAIQDATRFIAGMVADKIELAGGGTLEPPIHPPEG